MIGEDGDVKDVLLSWLVEQRDICKKKDSQAVHSYAKAHKSLSSHDGAIVDPKSMKKLSGIGEKIVSTFQKYLIGLCKEEGQRLPDAWNPEASVHQRKEKRPGESNEGPVAPKRRKTKYVPRRRSGGYGILLALYLRDRDRSGLKKDEIIEYATKFCDSSFSSNPGSNEFYSAWNSIKSLEKNELVSFTGRRTLWFITDEGIEVAEKLRQVEGVSRSSPAVQKVVDTSYDNGHFATPDNSVLGSGGHGLMSDGIELLKHPRDLLPSHLLSSPVHARDESPKLFVPSSEPDFKLIPVMTENREKEKEREERKERKEREEQQRQRETEEQRKRETPQQESGQIESRIQKEPSKPVHDTAKKTLNGIKYSIWLPGDYEVMVIIDEREIKSRSERDYFENRLTSLGIKCEVRVLTVGDIVWIAKNKRTKEEVALNVICERKRLDDLAMSIRDGRFVEQKQRLIKASMKRYYYLVEEIASEIGFAQQLQTAQSMVMLLANFQLKRFKNTDETTMFLASLTNIIIDDCKARNLKLLVMKPRSIETQQEYGELMEMFRKEFEEKRRKSYYECCHLYSNFKDVLNKSQMVTVKEMFLSMLLTVKGVTIEKALAIQNRFPTPRLLLTYYHTEIHDKSEKFKQQALAHACYTPIGSKKISNSLSQKLFDIWGK